MARAVRVEFAGAAYHVMARGDRLEAIVRDDMDPATFLRTLAAASVRSGFLPGMGWLQNAFTRRAGARHGLWALFDYIHLNPVRAGIIAEKALQSLYDGSKWKKRRNRA
jgi:putative transposase